MPLNCRRAVVCLIPKKRDLHLIQNWHPISLLCADYKIFAKALVNLVKTVLSTVIHQDQLYCVMHRSMHDNICLVRDSWDVCEIQQQYTGLFLTNY